MLIIPFYANSRDDTYCVQACLKSVLKFYFPKKEYSFRYLDKVTAHKKEKWTWNSAMLLYLTKRGFETIDIGNLDYRKFAKHGDRYLRAIWPADIFEVQKKFSDLKNEQRLVRLLLKERRIKLLERPATLNDLRSLFSRGFIILCGGVNSYILERKKGYSPHMVIVTDISARKITFHDPGLPPRKNRKVSTGLFLRAWRYPTKTDASLIAVRLQRKK